MLWFLRCLRFIEWNIYHYSLTQFINSTLETSVLFYYYYFSFGITYILSAVDVKYLLSMIRDKVVIGVGAVAWPNKALLIRYLRAAQWSDVFCFRHKYEKITEKVMTDHCRNVSVMQISYDSNSIYKHQKPNRHVVSARLLLVKNKKCVFYFQMLFYFLRKIDRLFIWDI